MTEEADPSELKFVGPATASTIESAGFTAGDIRNRAVSFQMLTDAGVNAGVAARIRREHSLPWSFETEDDSDLERRSDQIRGLGEAERAWVADSAGDWETEQTSEEPAEADGSGDPVAAESAWRERSPTSVGELPDVDEETQRRLATAGITSVRSLAVADTDAVADALDLDSDRLAALQDAADQRLS